MVARYVDDAAHRLLKATMHIRRNKSRMHDVLPKFLQYRSSSLSSQVRFPPAWATLLDTHHYTLTHKATVYCDPLRFGSLLRSDSGDLNVRTDGRCVLQLRDHQGVRVGLVCRRTGKTVSWVSRIDGHPRSVARIRRRACFV